MTARKPRRRIYASEVLLAAGTAGLSAESIVMANQVCTISVQRLAEEHGSIDDPALREAVRQAPSLFLDLEP